MEKVLTL